MSSMVRTRWAAIGAAVAVMLGAGGIGLVSAGPLSSGERTVLVPINCRLADTRPAPDNVGLRNTPIGAGETVTFSAHGTNGNCTIPADATALSLNVTALDVTATLTFLTLWNADQARPTTSSLNPAWGQPPTPNAVTVDLSATGRFKLFNALGTLDVIIDVAGYYQDHNHDDRYYTEAESDAMAARVGYATGTANFSATGGGGIAEDVATLTVTAPADGRTITVVTVIVQVNTSGDQQSSWDLDVAKNGGTATTATTRVVSVVDPGGSTNPSDTITLSTQIVQEAGDTDVVTVSGARVAGVPLANIEVEIASVTARFDSTGSPPPTVPG